MQGFQGSVRARKSAATALAAAAAVGAAGAPASAAFVTSVQSFNQGTVAFADGVSTYNNSAAALGQPNRIAGAGSGFPGPVAPFNPPYEAGEVVSVGLGGQITLELPAAVPVTPGQLQIGIFHSAGLNDPTFGGQAEVTARTFAGREFGADRTAVVEVADALGNFKSLGRVTFTQPTQGYANQSTAYDFPQPPAASDFDKPFVGGLSSYDGLSQAQISTMLNGSAGGTWLSVSPAVAAELGTVRYVRISDPMWQVIGGGLAANRASAYDANFSKPADPFVDGVNVVPEPAGVGAVIGAIAVLAGRRRRRA